MIKVLHVNYSDAKGGAAIGVNRLHRSLLNEGILSKILVADKSFQDENIIGPSKTTSVILNQLKIAFSRFLKNKIVRSSSLETFSFNFFRSNLAKFINNFDADIVHLHWVGNEMISIKEISEINKPIIWSFWDMWPMCGAEHHSYNDRHIQGYTKNNKPNNEIGFDLNRIVWEKKMKFFSFDFKIVCFSKWIYDHVKKSQLFSNKKDILIIPCAVDLEEWKPRDKNISKDLFNLPKEKKLMLFGSATSTNHRKGFDFLIDSLNENKNKFQDYSLIIFGEKPKNLEKLKINYKFLGKITDEKSLNFLYSSVDLVLMPSLIETFGQISLEAAACETPSIVFEKTGLTEFIKHKVNGYISKYGDKDDFINGIFWCTQDENKLKSLGKNGREIISKSFNSKILAKEYKKLYNDSLYKTKTAS